MRPPIPPVWGASPHPFMLQKIDPLPPQPIPTTPPSVPTYMWKEKPLLKSKTIISIVGTILFFALSKFFGIEVDWQGIVGTDGIVTFYEALLLVGAAFAAYFRKIANGPINGVVKPPEG